MTRSRLAGITIFVVVALVYVLVIGCSDPVSIESEDECKGNRNPQIGLLRYLVNEELMDNDVDVIVTPTDTLELWVQYDDPDDNLAGGDVWWALDGGDFARVKSLPSNLPDDGTGSNRGYLYQVELTGLSNGLHTFELGFTDVCGAPSQKLEGEFTIQGGDIDDDDDDTTPDDDDATPDDDDDDDFEDGLLQNGDFEEGHTIWDEDPVSIITINPPAMTEPLPSGSWAAFFNGVSNQNQTLQQTVFIPNDTVTLTLSFKAFIISEEAIDASDDDLLTVEIRQLDDTLLQTIIMLSDDDQWYGWVSRSEQIDNASQYGGQQLKVVFHFTGDDDDNATYYVIDNVALIKN